ncbi:MAG: ParB/RepB/Spo0J family partition protein [Pseudomonadota bacterium]
MIKKRGLGRDLDSLLGGTLSESILATTTLTETVKEGVSTDGLRKLPVEYLQRGQFQPRQDMAAEALEELAESIRAQGIIQPILVRQVGENKYEIIAGERRWRAAQLAEYLEVPVIIRELSDETAMAMALIENIQREDLNPMEKAHALKRLLDECGLRHEDLARTVGKSRATVTNLLRLLNLNLDVKTMLERGDLEMGHARTLLALEGERQSQAARTVVERELSVRETEILVRRILNGTVIKKAIRPADPDVLNLQNELSDKLGATVTILHNPKGKGKLIIPYNSLEEFEGIMSHIN